MDSILLASAFVLGGGLVGALFAWRAKKAPRSPSAGPGEGFERRRGMRGSPGGGFRASMVSALRDPFVSVERIEAVERELADDLRGYLGDVAAQHGADDAMLWLRPREHAAFEPVAWNQPGAPPSTLWGSEAQRAIVTWAAGEGVVSFDAAEGSATLAACRVPLDSVPSLGASGQAGGALVLSSAGGIQGGRDDVKLWLPRHAQRIAQLVELQVTRNEVARQNRQMRALVRNAQELQVTGEQEELERRIAESVLEASGATFVALVAWDGALRRGAVRHATAHYPRPVPQPDQLVEPGSLVGTACLDGTPRLWEDARALAGREPLYAVGGSTPLSGTLAILPLQRTTVTLGALVIGSDEPGVIRQSDLRTAKLIAQLAASALEAAWEIEEVSRRSRTDQLTGLWNRRHFDEELRRALDQTDRFGGTCTMVVIDLDHFKQVNDTHGHEAGDEVLKAVADVMSELVRTTDVCARIGGEEFCLILPQTLLAGAVELAERLRARIETSSVRWKGREVRVTASFGVATYDAGSGQPRRARLFEAADGAMYTAKREGRNCVRTG
ncbi:MAG: diguanylate cyclase [Gemmatimonadales bacterium]